MSGENLMRRHLLIILSVLLLGLIPAAHGQEADPSQSIETIYGLVTLPLIDVRAGPDFAYPTIGQLELNTSVVILGRAGDFINRWDGRQWLQIEYGQTKAWIYGRLLRTSVAFNSIFPTGRPLPRDANGRVPEGFDLTTEVCSQWQGDLVLTGNFMAGDTELTVTYPLLQGATVYNVIAIAPDGQRTSFTSTTNTARIVLSQLPWQAGVYTWRVAPYWTVTSNRSTWQQVCLLRTGGTFEKPNTSPYRNP
jgi:hypothetical protein